MTTLLVIIWGIVAVILLVANAIRPERTRRSWFELQRHKDEQLIKREEHITDIDGLRRIVTGIALIALAVIGWELWQGWGLLAVIIVWVFSGAITRQKIISKNVAHLYKKYEPSLLSFVISYPVIGSITRIQNWHPHDQRIESREHLLHLVDNASMILTSDEQKIIHKGLDWHTTRVEAIMTPVSEIVSIKHNELLGPLVLDDLHRSGHDRFPVTRGDSDEMIGVLDITDVLEIDSGKHSQTAEKAMMPRVLYINEKEFLPVALTMLQKSRQHMLIVVDEHGATVGLVTLADITNLLLGP